MTPKYTIGLDFGTESGRVLLVDVADGSELASVVVPYPHGVIDRELPESHVPLGPDWALQDPSDYLEVLQRGIPAALRESGVRPADVIGLGLDFTSCTILPVDDAGTPLCLQDEPRKRPHAWVKLWKHHAAQAEADHLNSVAAARQEGFLVDYGGKTSSEWMGAKVLQILREDEKVYEATAAFMEAGDWVVRVLTGEIVRNTCGAGYKAYWSRERGFPNQEFFKALDPRLSDFRNKKLPGKLLAPGERAGSLLAAIASKIDLPPDLPVAAPIIDAHAAVPACAVTHPGTLVLVLGTSTCHMLVDEKKRYVEGVAGVVKDGIISGFYGYEAGQAAVGDIFVWFTRNLLSAGADEARVFAQLEQEANNLLPGQTGLLALDWWNGNRSVLVDANLSGLIVGLTLASTPAQIYRALLEATGFGTRRIIDAFESSGVQVQDLVACGGLAEKNPLLLQIYADITHRPLKVARTRFASALGAAMLGAVAAGCEGGGYADLTQAARGMARLKEKVFEPTPASKQVYDPLYAEYLKLHDHFGRGGNEVMKRLRSIKLEGIQHEA